MAGKAFLFSVPTLPKPVYEILIDIRDKFGLSSQQMVIMGVMAVRHIHTNDSKVLEEMVETVKGVYCLNFKASVPTKS